MTYFADSQVRTDFAQIDETHFTLTICDADNLNHIAVFLTGITPFPDGTAGLGKYRFTLKFVRRNV